MIQFKEKHLFTVLEHAGGTEITEKSLSLPHRGNKNNACPQKVSMLKENEKTLHAS